MAENEVQARMRLEATRLGWRLWRNNVGVLRNPQGHYVRYGLCNDSPQLNSVLKSSDLIGIRPILITPDMVGKTIGQFVAREIKREGWIYRDVAHEKAQKNFIDLINGLGGDAAFSTGEGKL
jgi:hypothetical protein